MSLRTPPGDRNDAHDFPFARHLQVLVAPAPRVKKRVKKHLKKWPEGSDLICISVFLGSSILRVFLCHIAFSVVAVLATVLGTSVGTYGL